MTRFYSLARTQNSQCHKRLEKRHLNRRFLLDTEARVDNCSNSLLKGGSVVHPPIRDLGGVDRRDLENIHLGRGPHSPKDRRSWGKFDGFSQGEITRLSGLWKSQNTVSESVQTRV